MKKKTELLEVSGTDYEVDGCVFCSYIPKTELKDMEENNNESNKKRD